MKAVEEETFQFLNCFASELLTIYFLIKSFSLRFVEKGFATFPN